MFDTLKSGSVYLRLASPCIGDDEVHADDGAVVVPGRSLSLPLVINPLPCPDVTIPLPQPSPRRVVCIRYACTRCVREAEQTLICKTDFALKSHLFSAVAWT